MRKTCSRNLPQTTNRWLIFVAASCLLRARSVINNHVEIVMFFFLCFMFCLFVILFSFVFCFVLYLFLFLLFFGCYFCCFLFFSFLLLLFTFNVLTYNSKDATRNPSICQRYINFINSKNAYSLFLYIIYVLFV